jgi:hypothetical protein
MAGEVCVVIVHKNANLELLNGNIMKRNIGMNFFLKKRTLSKNQEIILDSCACHNKEAYSFTE